MNTSYRNLAIVALVVAAAASGVVAGERKWRDSTGINIRTVNRNAALIRRAESRQNRFINPSDPAMEMVRGPSGTLYFCQP